MKKKSAIAILIAVIMCIGLVGCGKSSSFDELMGYVIENGEQEIVNDETWFTVELETDDSYIMGPVYLTAITTDGTTETCNSARVFVYNSDPEDPALDYLQINNETNTFTSAHYWSTDDTYLMQKGSDIVELYHEYHVAESPIDSYERDTTLYGNEYECVTGKLLRENVVTTTFTEEVLDRLQNGLSPIGFGVADLGFNSFEASMSTIQENIDLWGDNI